jgi:hypothetical protein
MRFQNNCTLSDSLSDIEQQNHWCIHYIGTDEVNDSIQQMDQ